MIFSVLVYKFFGYRVKFQTVVNGVDFNFASQNVIFQFGQFFSNFFRNLFGDCQTNYIRVFQTDYGYSVVFQSASFVVFSSVDDCNTGVSNCRTDENRRNFGPVNYVTDFFNFTVGSFDSIVYTKTTTARRFTLS